MTPRGRGWFAWSLWIALAIQGVGVASMLVFADGFQLIHDVIYLPSWIIGMEGILPLNYIDHHKSIDNYIIATTVNLPCIWLGVLLIGLPIRVLLSSRKGT